MFVYGQSVDYLYYVVVTYLSVFVFKLSVCFIDGYVDYLDTDYIVRLLLHFESGCYQSVMVLFDVVYVLPYLLLRRRRIVLITSLVMKLSIFLVMLTVRRQY